MPDPLDAYGENGLAAYGYGGLVTDGGEPIRQPFGDSPHTIPGRIPAAEFDLGGEDIAYHETTDRASWAVDDFRTDSPVDIKLSPDDSAEYAIGRFQADEWLAYTVALEPGTYSIRARVGTPHNDRQLTVSLDGEPLTTLDVPKQPDWSTYTTVSADVTIDGDAREGSLRLSPTKDGVDVAWLEFVAAPEPDPEPEPEPTHDHSTVDLTVGGQLYRIVCYGTPPEQVSASVTGGLSSGGADLTVGSVPQCAGATGDGGRCSREADVEEGSRTCWQHDASDIPDGGWG